MKMKNFEIEIFRFFRTPKILHAMRTQTDRAPRDLNEIASDQNVVKIMLVYFQKTMVSLCSGARKTMKSQNHFPLTAKPMNTTPNLDICTQFREMTLN